eukprot:jgi/Psemu1/45428/gm1.45428_g
MAAVQRSNSGRLAAASAATAFGMLWIAVSCVDQGGTLPICNAFRVGPVLPLRKVSPAQPPATRAGNPAFSFVLLKTSSTDTVDVDVDVDVDADTSSLIGNGSEETASEATKRVDVPKTTTTAPTSFWNRLESIMFGFLDVDESTNASETDDDDDDDPRLVLAHWDNLWECDGSTNNSSPVESLEHFLEVWARTTLSNDRGLTTPVSCNKFRVPSARKSPAAEMRARKAANRKSVDEEEEASTQLPSNARSMKLIFRPPKRYLSYKEQKSMEKGVLPDRKGAKVDAWSPGGIEIMISTKTSEASNRAVLDVMVRRCDIDGDTVIKKTTERAIIRRLEDALRIWKTNREKKRQQ